MHMLVGFRLLIANNRSLYKQIVNVRNYSGVNGNLSIKHRKKQTNKKYLKKDKRRKLNRKEFCNKHDKARPLVIYRLRSIDPVQFNISMVIFLALISARLS